MVLYPKLWAGGAPCVFAAWPGRRLGVRDARSIPFTDGVPKVVAALEATTPRSVWAVIIENVEGATTVSDGEALLRLLM